MLVWTWRQAIFVILMMLVIMLVIAHPSWYRTYEVIFDSMFAVLALLAFFHLFRR